MSNAYKTNKLSQYQFFTIELELMFMTSEFLGFQVILELFLKFFSAHYIKLNILKQVDIIYRVVCGIAYQPQGAIHLASIKRTPSVIYVNGQVVSL